MSVSSENGKTERENEFILKTKFVCHQIRTNVVNVHHQATKMFSLAHH